MLEKHDEEGKVSRTLPTPSMQGKEVYYLENLQ